MRLYDALAAATGSPVVELNRAIAIAHTLGAARALSIVDALQLDGFRFYHSSRPELLSRPGRVEEARAEYERALDLTPPGPEEHFLRHRIDGLRTTP